MTLMTPLPFFYKIEVLDASEGKRGSEESKQRKNSKSEGEKVIEKREFMQGRKFL